LIKKFLPSKAEKLNAGQKADFKGNIGKRNSGLSGLEH
jgi:hypothetical protein